MAAVGCGLDLPGSSGAAGRSGWFILSGETGEAPTRPGATRGGERAGSDITSRSVRGRGGGEGLVLGPTGIRESQGCGFNCC